MTQVEITPGTSPGLVQAQVTDDAGNILFGGTSDPIDVFYRCRPYVTDVNDLAERIASAEKASRGIT